MTTLSPEEWAILSPEQRAEHKRAELLNVFGFDVKFDRQGRPIEQGLGSESNPTVQSSPPSSGQRVRPPRMRCAPASTRSWAWSVSKMAKFRTVVKSRAWFRAVAALRQLDSAHMKFAVTAAEEMIEPEWQRELAAAGLTEADFQELRQ